MRMFQFVTTIGLLCISAIGSADCIPTPHRTTGTHYEPVKLQRGDMGKGLAFSGRVLATPDCTPVAGARVAHWQAGEDGRYQDRFRGYLFTDAQGQFAFETEWPNLVPPHIHFIVTKEGYDVLETQWIGSKRQATVGFDMVIEKK